MQQLKRTVKNQEQVITKLEALLAERVKAESVSVVPLDREKQRVRVPNTYRWFDH